MKRNKPRRSLLLFRDIPTIRCVFVAFSVLKVIRHYSLYIHADAIAKIQDHIPLFNSLPDSMISYHLFVAFSYLPYLSIQIPHYNYLIILPVDIFLELFIETVLFFIMSSLLWSIPCHKQYSGGSNLQDHACHPVVYRHTFVYLVVTNLMY